MMVPLSEAVARIVPSLFNTIQDSGDLCASTTLIASSLMVSNKRTSPVVGTICVQVNPDADEQAVLAYVYSRLSPLFANNDGGGELTVQIVK